MSLKLDNRSGYDTEDLRRLIRRGLRACGVRGTVFVTVMASPIRSRGCADVGGRRMVLPIAPPSRTSEKEQIRRLARVLEHECEHLKGVQHGHMPKQILYSSGATPAWARGLRLKRVGRAPDQMKAMLGGFRDSTMKKQRDAGPPSSRRGQTAGSYRFAVTTALIREHRMTDARAGRLVQKWRGVVESRMADRKTATSTAEHVARFERQGMTPMSRDRARRRRRS